MKRIITLAIPLAVLIVVVMAFVMLETQRGPDWSIELDEYIAHSALPSETITMQSVVEASKPWNFSEAMGEAVRDDWRWMIDKLPFPPQAVQCVLLERSRRPTTGAEEELRRQVVFVGYHTDGLYRVGWLVHKGVEEPFTQEMVGHLAMIGCDLGLE